MHSLSKVKSEILDTNTSYPIPFTSITTNFSLISLIFPDNEEWTCRGVVHGKIATELTGHDGFGYDPLFIENKSGLTYAQMSLEEKNEISHRAIAIKKACQKIRSKINS